MKKLSSFKYIKDDKESLKREYIESLEDKEFSFYIKSLSIKEDLAIRYTSKLKQSLLESNNSKHEHKYEDCPNSVGGMVLTPIIGDDFINFGYVPCSCNKGILNSSYFDMPITLRKARVEDIYTNDAKREDLIKFISNFIKSYPNFHKGAYIFGSFGTGKTYMVAALFNKLAEKGYKSIIVHMPELVRGLKSSFDTDYASKFEEIKNIPILLLDDIGAEYITPWSRDEVIEPIVNYRMEAKLPTFFTSNFTLDTLADLYTLNGDRVKAERIIERIKAMTEYFTLVSEDLRK